MNSFQQKVINLLDKTEGVIVGIKKNGKWLPSNEVTKTNTKCWRIIDQRKKNIP